MNSLVYSFSDLPAELRTAAGGKGGALARLFQAGYPVPDGFVILPEAFDEDVLGAESYTQVQDQLRRLRDGGSRDAFAVRSSAWSEDSTQVSFAGEFETVLDVHSDEEIRQAIATVRASRHSERVRAYSQAHNIHDEHEMAVVVQRLAPAQISGVLFTAHPVSGDRAQMVGNFVHGLGEALVSGQASAEEFRLQRPRGEYDGPVELAAAGKKLFKLAQRLERELGGPQDIEWALADKKIYILQSRPITTLLGENPRTGEINHSLTGDYVWSSVNLGEALAVVMTPYTWSVMRIGFSQMDILPGYAYAGNICGRLYQNVTVGATLIKALGQDIKTISREMGGVRQEYIDTMDEYLKPLPVSANPLRILWNGLRMQNNLRRGVKGAAEFTASNPAWCREMEARINTVFSSAELASLEHELLARAVRAFWHMVGTAWRYGELIGPLREELIAMVGGEQADILLSNVSREEKTLASLGPVIGLSRLARGEISRETYLQEYGHRSDLETEFSEPRPFEDPNWLDRQLAAFEAAPVDVDALLEKRRLAFESAWADFQARFPRQSKRVWRKLEACAEIARLREAARSESTRVIWVSRCLALRIGEITGIGEGVFFLSYEELIDLLHGDERAAAFIPARQETYERYKTLPPYPRVIRGRFDPFQWAADPQRRMDVFDSHGFLDDIAVIEPDENVVTGTAGSAGRAEGLVRRIDSPDEGHLLQPGEILVAAQTNIGWTLFFPRAAAVVTDVGAPLSHAAIVARELGIPAVVNCDNATQRLRTGDRILVDGTRGVVKILERAG